MIKELIFILVLIVIILCAVVAKPTSILKVTKDADTSGDTTSAENTQSVEKMDVSTVRNVQRRKSNKTSRVRFSPEKILRTYNVKTGAIVGDTTVQIDEAESEN